MTEVIERAVRRLAATRPLFHSEADLQHALAWQLQLDEPDVGVRLERRMATTPRVELDLLVELAGRRLAVELKYPRAALSIELGDEAYDLRAGAADVDSYGVVRDLWRLERLLREDLVDAGCALVVTNNRALWKPAERETLWDAFRLTDGATVSGLRQWRPTEKTWPGPPIELAGQYEIRWRDFSIVPGFRGNRQFRYLLLPVTHEGTSAVRLSDPIVEEPESSPLQESQGSVAERGRSAAREALERAGYAVAEDETRRNRLTITRDGATATVWVATRRGYRYPFWVKRDWQPSADTFACLVRLPEPAGAPQVYVIPTTKWASPGTVFVSRNYAGGASPPEWGINLSARNMPELTPYLMPAAAALLP